MQGTVERPTSAPIGLPSEHPDRRSWLKRLLVAAGRRCPADVLNEIDSALSYLTVGRWFGDRGFVVPLECETRAELFARVASRFADERVAYVEFGVYAGDSMRMWSRLLTHPQATLHGFDSFQGAPEKWTHSAPRGHWRTAGPPEIDDSRVRFFAGWFDETLRGYVPPPHDVLYIAMDAAVYSSTKLVLDRIRPFLAPGTYLYFGALANRAHELRALDEFLAEHPEVRLRVIAAAPHLTRVVFQVVD